MKRPSSLEQHKIVQAVIGMNDSPAEQSDRASRRSVVLVTGMSGSGKSTVLAALKRRGHRVIDTDDPSWIVETHTLGGPEPVWDLEQIKALIDDHAGPRPTCCGQSPERASRTFDRACFPVDSPGVWLLLIDIDRCTTARPVWCFREPCRGLGRSGGGG